MSRHQLPTKNPRYEVFVGWDPPQRTYFCQVFDREGEKDEQPFIWLGPGSLRPIASNEIRQAISPYAEVSPELAKQLREDKRLDRG